MESLTVKVTGKPRRITYLIDDRPATEEQARAWAEAHGLDWDQVSG